MAASPLPPPSTSLQDITHLQLISIFHYIWAGLIALASLFGLMFFVLGFVVGSEPQQAGEPSPEVVGAIFSGVGMVIALVALGIAAAVFMAGRFISRRRNHTYCLVIGALDCLSFPLGTALGVFTLIVLSRPSVKALFDASSGPPPPPPPPVYQT